VSLLQLVCFSRSVLCGIKLENGDIPFLRMKKIMIGVIIVIALLIMVGLPWDKPNKTEFVLRDSLVTRGVPANVIILDGKGYRTISSVINANKVYGLKNFTIISQKFHNERAIYQAENLGLDVDNIQAYNAKTPRSRRAYLTTIREYFARVKLFADLITYDDKTDRNLQYTE